MIVIPLSPYNPWFEMTVIIDNKTWGLEFSFNTMMQKYIFSVSESDGTPVLSGIPLEINIPLTEQYRNSSYNLPAGEFWYIAGTPPTPETLGTEGSLIFRGAGND
jgi:hypothetical protein